MEVVFNPNTLFRRDAWYSRVFYSVRYFFKYKLGKWHRNLVKTAFKGEPWDYDFLFKLEYAKIREMLEWHKEKHRFEGVEFTIRDLRICLSLLGIIMGERQLFHYEGKLLSEPTGDGEMRRIVESPDFKYVPDVYVNTRNIGRFVDKENLRDFYTKFPGDLYVLKARHLYHKIRLEEEETWWD